MQRTEHFYYMPRCVSLLLVMPVLQVVPRDRVRDARQGKAIVPRNKFYNNQNYSWQSNQVPNPKKIMYNCFSMLFCFNIVFCNYAQLRVSHETSETGSFYCGTRRDKASVSSRTQNRHSRLMVPCCNRAFLDFYTLGFFLVGFKELLLLLVGFSTNYSMKKPSV